MTVSVNTKTTDWHNCYDDGWRGVIVDEAYAHPAKFSYGLITRIVRRMVDEGWITAGQVCGDPFGGVGLGGIIASYYGLHWVGVELEERFCALAEQNFKLHRPRWANLPGCAEPRIISGDSRRFAALVGEVAACVTSPPYAEITRGGNMNTGVIDCNTRPSALNPDNYGTTPGQIGALKEGRLDAVISSPPYAVTNPAKSSDSIDYHKQWETYRAQGGGSGFEAFCAVQQRHAGGYGTTEGNIGNLPSGKLDAIVTSPPYSETFAEKRGGSSQVTDDSGNGGPLPARVYGASEGNIGNLREGTLSGVVTSPPYEGTSLTQDEEYWRKKFEKNPELAESMKARGAGKPGNNATGSDGYGFTAGQIGNTAGDTYWQAMAAVYGQMHLAMKPGATAAIVIKDYVSKGKRVPLCDDTCTLLTHLGFDVFERTRAWLVKRDEHPGLFGEPVVKETKRISFFRRLAEKKGAPPIHYEEVIWCRR